DRPGSAAPRRKVRRPARSRGRIGAGGTVSGETDRQGDWRRRNGLWLAGRRSSSEGRAALRSAAMGPRRGHSSRYSAYTGGPDPLAPPVDLREALEQIGQDVMEGSSPRRALSELMRRGTENMRGADKLAAEANRRRRELLQRNNLDGTLQEIKKL